MRTLNLYIQNSQHMLKLINSKTFRLAQLLSEKLADGITANVRICKKPRKRICKQDKQVAHGGQGKRRFLFWTSNLDTKMRWPCLSSKFVQNSCHQGQIIQKPSITCHKSAKNSRNLVVRYISYGKP